MRDNTGDDGSEPSNYDPDAILEDEDGRWVRFDDAVDDITDDPENREQAERVITEMVDGDAPLRSKTVDGDEYVQLTGFRRAQAYYAKEKAKQHYTHAKHRAARFLGRGGDGECR